MAFVLDDLLQISLTNPAVRAFGVGVIRSVLGYLENVASGKTEWSWNKFAETFLRIMPQAFGLSAAGIPPEAALVTDWGVGKVANAIKS